MYLSACIYVCMCTYIHIRVCVTVWHECVCERVYNHTANEIRGSLHSKDTWTEQSGDHIATSELLRMLLRSVWFIKRPTKPSRFTCYIRLFTLRSSYNLPYF